MVRFDGKPQRILLRHRQDVQLQEVVQDIARQVKRIGDVADRHGSPVRAIDEEPNPSGGRAKNRVRSTPTIEGVDRCGLFFRKDR
jgi:hypothetical protein